MRSRQNLNVFVIKFFLKGCDIIIKNKLCIFEYGQN